MDMPSHGCRFECISSLHGLLSGTLDCFPVDILSPECYFITHSHYMCQSGGNVGFFPVYTCSQGQCLQAPSPSSPPPSSANARAHRCLPLVYCRIVYYRTVCYRIVYYRIVFYSILPHHMLPCIPHSLSCPAPSLWMLFSLLTSLHILGGVRSEESCTPSLRTGNV